MRGRLRELRRALAQGAAVLALTWVLALYGCSAGAGGAIALIDDGRPGMGNTRYVLTSHNGS